MAESEEAVRRLAVITAIYGIDSEAAVVMAQGVDTMTRYASEQIKRVLAYGDSRERAGLEKARQREFALLVALDEIVEAWRGLDGQQRLDAAVKKAALVKARGPMVEPSEKETGR